MHPQRFQKTGRRFCRTAVKDLSVHSQHNNTPFLILGNAAQKRIFLPDSSKPLADIDRLIQRRMHTFYPGCDQKGIHAHLARHSVRHHVTDDHTVSILPESFQYFRHLICVLHCADIQMIPKQIAECMRRSRNAGKSYDCIQTGIIFRQLHRA